MKEKNKKILELTSDIVFKTFMMENKTKNYKARLISLITGIDEKALKKADYKSIELPVKNKQNKIYKTDIIVTCGKKVINLEMNKDYYKEVVIKNSEYTSTIMSNMYKIGEMYDIEKVVIQISIDNYNKYPENKLLHKFILLEEEGHYKEEKEYEGIIKYHINLDFLKKKCYTNNRLKIEEKITELEKLCLLFIIEKEEDMKLLEGEIMEEAKDTLKEISEDKDIIEMYDYEAAAERLYNTRIYNAKQEGIEKGIKKGIKQGIKEGLAEGEKNERLKIATNLKKDGIPLEVISKNTGLSIEKIEKL